MSSAFEAWRFSQKRRYVICSTVMMNNYLRNHLLGMRIGTSIIDKIDFTSICISHWRDKPIEVCYVVEVPEVKMFFSWLGVNACNGIMWIGCNFVRNEKKILCFHGIFNCYSQYTWLQIVDLFFNTDFQHLQGLWFGAANAKFQKDPKEEFWRRGRQICLFIYL